MPEQMPITASFVLTPEEIKTARSVFFEQPRGTKVNAWVAIVIGVIALTYAVSTGWIRVNRAAWDLRSLLLVLGFCALLYFFFRRQRSQREQQALLHDPALNRRIEVHFSPDGLVSKVDGLSEGSSQWSAYVRVRRNPKGFVFYQNAQVVSWVPSHAFASSAEADAVAALAKERVKDFSES